MCRGGVVINLCCLLDFNIFWRYIVFSCLGNVYTTDKSLFIDSTGSAGTSSLQDTERRRVWPVPGCVTSAHLDRGFLHEEEFFTRDEAGGDDVEVIHSSLCELGVLGDRIAVLISMELFNAVVASSSSFVTVGFARALCSPFRIFLVGFVLTFVIGATWSDLQYVPPATLTPTGTGL